METLYTLYLHRTFYQFGIAWERLRNTEPVK
jgi:hypothetical protein